MSIGLRRCASCGGIIYDDDDDFMENVDLTEFCMLCNEEFLHREDL